MDDGRIKSTFEQLNEGLLAPNITYKCIICRRGRHGIPGAIIIVPDEEIDLSAVNNTSVSLDFDDRDIVAVCPSCLQRKAVFGKPGDESFDLWLAKKTRRRGHYCKLSPHEAEIAQWLTFADEPEVPLIAF